MKGMLVFIHTPKELDNTPDFILKLNPYTLIRAIRGRPVVFWELWFDILWKI